MRALDSKLLQKLLRAAAERLDGEWLLIGGTLLPAIGVETRPTVDVDLVSLEKASNEQNLKLMELAESLQLPVETINQAAGYFLQKIGYTQNELILLIQGSRATIYRPSLTLFWKLKIGRLSESDLSDCLEYLKYTRNQGESIDAPGLMTVLDQALQACLSESDRAERLKLLKQSLKP
ncbi:MAG: hypothetical protein RJB38_1135 [Pseudomonadota bacterium]|jgi:hypothetical protein